MCDLKGMLLCVLCCLVPLTVSAGDLDPPAGPSDAGSAMFTLEDIYNRLVSGAAGAKRTGAFREPTSGPGATGHTLDEVMAAAPRVDDTNGAGVADVLDGKTFWGLKSGVWGTHTGTLATQTLSADSYIVAAGNYAATTLDAVDSDLATGNIKKGTTIFGVVGSVIEATGNAAVGEVLEDKTFSNAGGADKTGTMPDREGDNASTAQDAVGGVNYFTAPEGYYDGDDRVSATDAQVAALDTDISASNIRSKVNIFGVVGNSDVVDTSSGDAEAGDIMKDKKAWVEGLELSGTRYGGCTCERTLNGTRWCDNGDGTVTDMLGYNGKGQCLVWLKDASWGGQYALWVNTEGGTNAHDRAAQLKTGVGGLTDGSVEGDWRLPTKTELVGLVNGPNWVRCVTPQGPCDLYGFTGVQAGGYTGRVPRTRTIGRRVVRAPAPRLRLQRQ
ncbi:MAG: DUF1566 domain-containing protein [Deltaproteobacteria bacterium]|nr:DUF1566 domain-containing protein [Deltaproteobacteria bacterium]